MNSASTTMVTRCPKCATAFRITSAQLQSAKGSVRCGSCLHVFKAQEHLVSSTAKPATPVTSEKAAPIKTIPPEPQKTAAPAAPTKQNTASQPPIAPKAPPKPSASTAKPVAAAAQPKTTPAQAVINPAAQTPKPAAPVIKKSSLDDIEDILISDDMDEKRQKNESGDYDFDEFMEIKLKPQISVSLFDRTIRDDKEDEVKDSTDESWAEMLIDDEEGTKLSKAVPVKNKTPEEKHEAPHQHTAPKDSHKHSGSSDSKPNLVFSLIADAEHDKQTQDHGHTEQHNQPALDTSIFETPDETHQPATGRRPTKTDPKMRAYDGSGSRAALLMNIIPAPVEFTAKRMRRWYQQKLWPSLSVLALLILIVQMAWLKFDYFSRVEPYRTAYLYLCPVFGCKLPALIDTRQIKAYNLLVRAHPDIENALLVDAIILNKAPFEQPFPDLVLAFSDMNDKPVASRRFSPKEYLGGELAGKEYMPRDTPIRLTLDLIDPGAEAVNYHVYIPEPKKP